MDTNEIHYTSDLDSGPFAQHHTLGIKPSQASPGDHIHDGVTSVYLNLSGGGSSLTIQDEGVSLPVRSLLNFTGAGVSATDSGTATTVTIAGGGGGGSSTGVVLYGSGAPTAGLGSNGDWYVDTSRASESSWRFYGPKISGSWSSDFRVLGMKKPGIGTWVPGDKSDWRYFTQALGSEGVNVGTVSYLATDYPIRSTGPTGEATRLFSCAERIFTVVNVGGLSTNGASSRVGIVSSNTASNLGASTYKIFLDAATSKVRVTRGHPVETTILVGTINFSGLSTLSCYITENRLCNVVAYGISGGVEAFENVGSFIYIHNAVTLHGPYIKNTTYFNDGDNIEMGFISEFTIKV